MLTCTMYLQPMDLSWVVALNYMYMYMCMYQQVPLRYMYLLLAICHQLLLSSVFALWVFPQIAQPSCLGFPLFEGGTYMYSMCSFVLVCAWLKQSVRDSISTCTLCMCVINKYGSYLLIRDWADLKWRPVLKVWQQLQDKHSEDTQNSYRRKPLAILM